MPALLRYASAPLSSAEKLRVLQALQQSQPQKLERFVALNGPKLLEQWISLEAGRSGRPDTLRWYPKRGGKPIICRLLLEESHEFSTSNVSLYQGHDQTRRTWAAPKQFWFLCPEGIFGLRWIWVQNLRPRNLQRGFRFTIPVWVAQFRPPHGGKCWGMHLISWPWGIVEF